MPYRGLGDLTCTQMRNRAHKAFHEQKQFIDKGHQAVPHLKMTEAMLWDIAADLVDKGHGYIPSLPARRVAQNINELCDQLINTKNKGKKLDAEVAEGMTRCDVLLRQAQIVLDAAAKLCKGAG